MRRLRHITAATGDVAFSTRDDVRADVMATLYPLIEAGGGAVPSVPGLFADFWRRNDGEGKVGAMAYQIAPGRADAEAGQSRYVMGMMCWAEDASVEAWWQARHIHNTVSGAPTPWLGGDRPPLPPWLTASTGPGLVLAPPDVVALLGDLERCLFWAASTDTARFRAALVARPGTAWLDGDDRPTAALMELARAWGAVITTDEDHDTGPVTSLAFPDGTSGWFEDEDPFDPVEGPGFWPQF